MSNYPENDYRNYLEHSLGEWKVHKYIQKIGNRYIYPKVNAAKSAIRNSRAGRAVREGVRQYRFNKARRDISRMAVANTGSADHKASDSLKVRAGRAGRAARRALENAGRKARTGIASLAPRNLKRRFYRATGQNSIAGLLKEANRQRKLKSARRDIARRTAANTGSADYAASDSRRMRAQRFLRSLTSTANKQRVRTAIASFRPRNIRRKIKRRFSK